MVSNNEVLFLAGQLVEERGQPVNVFGFWSMGKIDNDPKRILGAYHRLEVLHQNRIHVVG